jgi:hypothetical protein
MPKLSVLALHRDGDDLALRVGDAEEFGEWSLTLAKGVAAEFPGLVEVVEPPALVSMASSAMSDSTPSWRRLRPLAAAGDFKRQSAARADDPDHRHQGRRPGKLPASATASRKPDRKRAAKGSIRAA